MKFVSNISEDEYQEIFNTHKANFLQSYTWGQFCIVGKKQQPFYVGLKDENNHLVCASLLLKTTLPMGLSYFYAPRGFIIDFNNHELLKIFTIKLKEFLHQEKAIYLKIDPEIAYQEVDNNAR